MRRFGLFVSHTLYFDAINNSSSNDEQLGVCRQSGLNRTFSGTVCTVLQIRQPAVHGWCV